MNLECLELNDQQNFSAIYMTGLSKYILLMGNLIQLYKCKYTNYSLYMFTTPDSMHHIKLNYFVLMVNAISFSFVIELFQYNYTIQIGVAIIEDSVQLTKDSCKMCRPEPEKADQTVDIRPKISIDRKKGLYIDEALILTGEYKSNVCDSSQINDRCSVIILP